MSHIPTFESFEVSEVTDAVVSVKLNSIEHVAARGDQVDNEFTVEVTITDGGQNQKGKYGPAAITLAPGQKKSIQEFIFIGEYAGKCNQDVGKIEFKFEAETDYVVGNFVGITEGNNALKQAGTYQFAAPVTLEQGSSQSVLVFRGRIDVSC